MFSPEIKEITFSINFVPLHVFCCDFYAVKYKHSAGVIPILLLQKIHVGWEWLTYPSHIANIWMMFHRFKYQFNALKQLYAAHGCYTHVEKYTKEHW